MLAVVIIFAITAVLAVILTYALLNAKPEEKKDRSKT